MLSKPKTTGPGTLVKFRRRQQKRIPRRPLEAVRADFDKWDAAAKILGINWSEFTRRALNAHAHAALSGYVLGVSPSDFVPLPKVSEKGGSKNGAPARAKPAAKRAGRKG